MEKNKKILVVIDTNKLGTYGKNELDCKNYAYLEINRHLHDNIVNNFSFETSKNVSIKVAIPEIVLEELKNHQYNSFNNNLANLREKFEKVSKMEGTELKIPKISYKDYINEKTSAYLGVYNIVKIPNPSNEVFQKVINKVINKEKPFYKKNNDVDSGFKDAIIWESILEFSSKNNYDKYFFLTHDKDFKDEKLAKEFLNLVGKELFIVSDVADLKGKLEEEIRGTENINNSLKSIEKNLLSSLKTIAEDESVNFISEGEEYEVSELYDYHILDIDSVNDIHKVSILLSLRYWSEYSKYALQGFIGSEDMLHEDNVQVEASLTFDKNFKLKEISSTNLLFNGDSEMTF